MQRRFVVLVEWSDDGTHDVDEVAVVANSPAKAISAARDVWSATKGAEWPHSRIERVDLLSSRMKRSLA